MTKASPTYDLVLTGGTLLDPVRDIHDRRDVAFKDSVVAEVAEQIDPASASATVDVSGKLITPGLIDLHGHFYHGGISGGVNPDQVCLASGTTTGVDAGSAGFENFGAMRDYVFPAQRTRLLAFLNIGAGGLVMNSILSDEIQDMRVIDIDQTVATIKSSPGFCFGVKVRMHINAMAHYNAHAAMKSARTAADLSGSLLMVHISDTPIPLPEVLEYLGPGDIATQAFNSTPECILDGRGKVRPEIRAAADRGVVMDVAHAGVHCDVEVVKAAMEQGLPPDTISTDVQNPQPGRTLYLMNDLVSKFHALGLPLNDAVAAATCRPARVLGLQESLGSLAPGMAGDAAVFEIREGHFTWLDMAGHPVRGEKRLDTYLTVRDGSVVWSEGLLTRMGEC